MNKQFPLFVSSNSVNESYACLCLPPSLSSPLLSLSLSLSFSLSLPPSHISPIIPPPHPPLGKSNRPAAVLSVVDMDDSRLSIELLLVACKLLRLALRGLPETDGLAAEFDIATATGLNRVEERSHTGSKLFFAGLAHLRCFACS